jgi:hypothetical protein
MRLDSEFRFEQADDSLSDVGLKISLWQYGL